MALGGKARRPSDSLILLNVFEERRKAVAVLVRKHLGVGRLVDVAAIEDGLTKFRGAGRMLLVKFGDHDGLGLLHPCPTHCLVGLADVDHVALEGQKRPLEAENLCLHLRAYLERDGQVCHDG